MKGRQVKAQLRRQLQRLQTVQRKYDWNNLFKVNQNIQ